MTAPSPPALSAQNGSTVGGCGHFRSEQSVIFLAKGLAKGSADPGSGAGMHRRAPLQIR